MMGLPATALGLGVPVSSHRLGEAGEVAWALGLVPHL